MKDLMKGKVALVTGGSSGIGRAVAVKLSSVGATVVITHTQRSKAEAEEVVSIINENDGKAISLPGEFSEPEQIVSAFQSIMDEFGRLDVVVSCAGAMTYVPIVDATEANFDEMFNINTKGTFIVMQQAAKHLSDNGRLVIISSPGSKLGQAGSGLYGGSKAALESFTRALAWELAPRSICVNTVWPGVTDTKTLADSYREIGASFSPFGKLGTPEDVAGVISLLMHDEAHWLTGQIIQAGGGASMY